MVAVLVANARPPGVRGLTAARPEPRDRAGHIDDAFLTIDVVISVLMPVLDNISFRANKMSKHIHHRVTVGPVKHYGCEPAYGGIHNHFENRTSYGVHEEFEQLETKPVHPDLPGKNLDHDGIVPTNLYNTANTAMICGAFDASIVPPMPLGRREPCQHQQHMACKSASRFSFEYLHGIQVVNGGSSTLYCAPKLEPYNKGIVPM